MMPRERFFGKPVQVEVGSTVESHETSVCHVQANIGRLRDREHLSCSRSGKEERDKWEPLDMAPAKAAGVATADGHGA